MPLTDSDRGAPACGYGLKVSLKPYGSRAPGPVEGQHVDGPAGELLPFAATTITLGRHGTFQLSAAHSETR
jgi:hypothetical protein